MKRLPVLSALALLASPSSMRAQEHAALPEHPREIAIPSLPPFAPPLPRHVALDGGGSIFVMQDASSDLLRGLLRYRAGTVEEPAGQVGVATLLADVMRTSGSLEYPGIELDDWLLLHTAELTIEARLEDFQVRFACPHEAWDGMLARLASLVREPAITVEALSDARARLTTRIAQRRADPSFVADWALAAVAYGAESPYARQPSAEALKAITAENLAAFHRESILAQDPVVGLIGEPSDDQARALGQALAVPASEPAQAGTAETGAAAPPAAGGGTERRGKSALFTGFIQPARTRIWVVDRPLAQFTEVRLAAPGVRRLDPDASELELWSRIVGRGGRAQRLGRRFLQRDVVAGFVPEWNRAGAFQAAFNAPNARVGEILQAMFEVLEASKTSIEQEHVDRVRRRLMNEELFTADTSVKALDRFLNLEFHGYPEDYYRQRVLSWRKADPAALSDAVSARLDLGRMVIVAVGPLAELSVQLAELGEVEPLSLERALSPGAEQPDRVEAMFQALGGRRAWADAVAIQAEIDIVMPDREIPTRQWSELGGPRFRAEYLVASDTVVLVVDEQRAVQVTTQGRTELGEEARLAQVEAKRRGLWQVLHRIARSAGVHVTLDEDNNIAVRDDEGLDVRLELDAEHRPRRLVARHGSLLEERELLDWSTDTPLAYPRRIVQVSDGLEWRIGAFEALAEFDPLLLEAGK